MKSGNFEICESDIVMLKLRELSTGVNLRVVVLYRNSNIALLHMNQSL